MSPPHAFKPLELRMSIYHHQDKDRCCPAPTAVMKTVSLLE